MELIPETAVERKRLLVVLLKTVGYELAHAESAMEQYWGKHLLEDWKSLALLAEREQVVRAAE